MFFELLIVAWSCCGRDFDIAGSQAPEAWNGLVSTATKFAPVGSLYFSPGLSPQFICQSSVFLFLSSFDSKHSIA
jgi:hypothetical protein